MHCRALNLPGDKKRRREPGRDGNILSGTGCCALRVLLEIPVYRPSRSLDQFRTQGFLPIESTAVQRCARESTEFASD